MQSGLRFKHVRRILCLTIADRCIRLRENRPMVADRAAVEISADSRVTVDSKSPSPSPQPSPLGRGRAATDPDTGAQRSIDRSAANDSPSPLAITMQLDAPFPLTPALSPGERENHLA